MAVLRASRRPSTDSIVTDLPDPDSPTIATTLPSPTAKDTSCTAATGPRSVRNVTPQVRDLQDRAAHARTLGSITA